MKSAISVLSYLSSGASAEIVSQIQDFIGSSPRWILLRTASSLIVVL
jgi:hypothetical protein